MNTDLSVVILAANEKLHIGRCLEKLLPLYGAVGKLPAGRVFVVDCFSTDGTQKIARSCGAEVVEHTWPGNQAEQFNWALDNLPIKTGWILRLDADEYLFPETIAEIREKLPQIPQEVTSLSLSRARTWMGEPVSKGVGAVILKRFFRTGIGRCEQRLMDEHIITSHGRDEMLKGAFIDDNLNDLSWWTTKHLNYAAREAIDLLNMEYNFIPESSDAGVMNQQSLAKRRKKMKYARMPLFWRALFYFCYRYFLRGGFLEGKAGFTWHFFQGLWYRMMVDARVYEIKKRCGNDRDKIVAYVNSIYGGQL